MLLASPLILCMGKWFNLPESVLKKLYALIKIPKALYLYIYHTDLCLRWGCTKRNYKIQLVFSGTEPGRSLEPRLHRLTCSAVGPWACPLVKVSPERNRWRNWGKANLHFRTLKGSELLNMLRSARRQSDFKNVLLQHNAL